MLHCVITQVVYIDQVLAVIVKPFLTQCFLLCLLSCTVRLVSVVITSRIARSLLRYLLDGMRMEEAKVCVCVRTCARGCVRACVGVCVGGWVGVSVCVGVHVRAYMCVQFSVFFS